MKLLVPWLTFFNLALAMVSPAAALWFFIEDEKIMGWVWVTCAVINGVAVA